MIGYSLLVQHDDDNMITIMAMMLVITMMIGYSLLVQHDDDWIFSTGTTR